MDTKLPSWLKQDIADAKTLEISRILSELGVHTVCREAKCPNINHCFGNNQATFMILGDSCTRNCRFCAVAKSKEGRLVIDESEPYRISQAVKILDLKYAVITSVTRDDLPDGGASIFARTIRLINAWERNIKVEALIPDFQGDVFSLKLVLDARPDVIAHNLETVRRLHPILKPLADYQLSLSVLGKIKELNPEINTKSSLMLGLGEAEEEVVNAMEDLRAKQCDILTLGQYLSPSINHYPVKEFISIGQFERYRKIGIGMGFKAVLSGPLVRSSYHAEELRQESLCMT